MNWQDILDLRVNFVAGKEKNSFSKARAAFRPSVLLSGVITLRACMVAKFGFEGDGNPTMLARCGRNKRRAGFMAYSNGNSAAIIN